MGWVTIMYIALSPNFQYIGAFFVFFYTRL